MTEVTADTEEEMLIMVLHRMMHGVVQGAGMPWRMIVVMIAAMIAEEAVADGGDLVVVARNGPAMTAVGVG